MSAPTNDGADFKTDPEVATTSTSVDFLSSDFNPLLALYSSDITLPFPSVPAFNNLAEYENVMVKEQREELPDPETRRSLIVKKASRRKQLKDTNAERREKILAITTKPQTEEQQKKEESIENLAKARHHRYHRNVLTRIEDCNVGPLSVLRKCVMNKHFVKVVTRSAVSVRGYCTGYIIAFDKHMNLAMIDVDECFIKPCLLKEKRERRKKKDSPAVQKSEDFSNPTKEIEGYGGAREDVAPRLTNVQSGDSLSEMRGTANMDLKLEKTESSHISSSFGGKSGVRSNKNGSLNSKDDKVHVVTPEVESPLFSACAEPFSSSGSDSGSDALTIDIPPEIKASFSDTKTRSVQSSSGKTSQKFKKGSEFCDRLLQDDQNKSAENKNVISDSKSSKVDSSSRGIISEREHNEDISIEQLSEALNKSVHLSEPNQRVRKNFTPTSVNILKRHVNQLFVRGDNIVYVSIIH